MLTQIRHWLDTLPFTNPLMRRQAVILQVFLFCFIVAALLQIIFIFWSGTLARDLLLIGVIVAFELVMLVALWILRRGHFRQAVVIVVSTLLLSMAINLFMSGLRTSQVGLVVFTLPITLAGMLLGRKGTLATFAASMGIVIAVVQIELHAPAMVGFAQTHYTPEGAIFLFGTTIALLALIVDQFGSAFQYTLTASRARERDLEQLRASLEWKVSQRTAELRKALEEVQAQAQEQARLLAENEQQREMLRELSVPVIPISTSELVIPLVGALDTARLRQLQEQALRSIERAPVRTVILDITGVPVIDSQVAQGLLSVVEATRLLGAETILVGIRPEVAQAIVSLGIDLRTIRTYSDLQSALSASLAL